MGELRPRLKGKDMVEDTSARDPSIRTKGLETRTAYVE